MGVKLEAMGYKAFALYPMGHKCLKTQRYTNQTGQWDGGGVWDIIGMGSACEEHVLHKVKENIANGS